MDSSVLDRKLVVLADIHGTHEIPEFVGRVVCQLHFRDRAATVALEIPQAEQARIDRYLASAGTKEDVAGLLQGEFWSKKKQYGIASIAMLALVEEVRRLKRDGYAIGVAAVDPGPIPIKENTPEATRAAGRTRDARMADGVLRALAAHPERHIVVLVGAIHASKQAQFPWDPDYRSMANLLSRKMPVLSLDVAHAGGAAWNCTPECGVHSSDPRHAEERYPGSVRLGSFAEGFDGAYFVGAISPAPPAAHAEAEARR